ncbi:putative zinc-finger-containing protein [Mycena pura]|uniref:Zinc-finger-containing protein n=1 Tax=Mycena pura TaxID=153505 RepID=A0AAD6VG91_9AGAR|nr:putative zinc-finger-containing protein [Mycena pura]
MPVNECYCARCDLYFDSLAQRSDHVQATATHPECDYCKRRFLNNNTLRNHYIYSRHHHYCASCEIEYQSPAGLRYHIEHAPVHCDDSDEEEDANDDTHIASPEWEEEMGQLSYPDEPAQPEDSDNSWEEYDDYDYEDAEELLDSLYEEDGQSDDDDSQETVVFNFFCPMCRKIPNSVCCTPCGHIFCLTYVPAAATGKVIAHI